MIPEFYARDEKGIPAAWVARMRESMARLDAALLRQSHGAGIHRGTLPPGGGGLPRARPTRATAGRQMVDWQHGLEQKWATLHFGEVKVETRGEQHVFEVQVCLDDLDPKAVRVELYADGVKGGAPVRQEMKRVRHTGRRVRRLHLQRGGVCGPPSSGLYGASDTTLRRRCNPSGRRSHPVAAMNRSVK